MQEAVALCEYEELYAVEQESKVFVGLLFIFAR